MTDKFRFIEYQGTIYVLVGIGFKQNLLNYYFYLVHVKDFNKYLEKKSDFYTISVNMDYCNEITDKNKLKLLKLLFF
jgi:hypothetical protein